MFYHYCNYCRTWPADFKSLDELSAVLHQHKFPYKLKDFETLGYKSYVCSNCNSSDRDRLYKMYLEKYLPAKKVKLLEFAPAEPIRQWLTKLDNVEYRSADLFMKNVDDEVDITNMEIYQDNYFDFFICSHVLEHVNDDTLALTELYRILKPGGKGILMAPIITKEGAFDEDPNEGNIAERWRRFAQDDHVRIYERKIFLERVKSSGFTVEELSYRQLGLINFIKSGIRLKSKLYVVSKDKK